MSVCHAPDTAGYEKNFFSLNIPSWEWKYRDEQDVVCPFNGPEAVRGERQGHIVIILPYQIYLQIFL